MAAAIVLCDAGLFAVAAAAIGPPLGTVHGTVTWTAAPGRRLLGIRPKEPGRASTATTDDEGRYELIYIRHDKGAKVGAHIACGLRARTRTPAQAARLPSRQNTQTVFTAEVKPGDNTIDFPLASK